MGVAAVLAHERQIELLPPGCVVRGQSGRPAVPGGRPGGQDPPCPADERLVVRVVDHDEAGAAGHSFTTRA